MFKDLFRRLGFHLEEPEIESKAHPRVSVDQPSKITIRLVPDNEFRHYELFLTLAILFLPIAATFTTAYLSIDTPKLSLGRGSLLFSAIAFWFTGFLFLFLALRERRKMFSGKIVRRSISLGDFKSYNREEDLGLGVEQDGKQSKK